jgi:porphobilinogen deaminase
MVQTEHVVAKLKELFPSVTFEVVPMTTTGDQVISKDSFGCLCPTIEHENL